MQQGSENQIEDKCLEHASLKWTEPTYSILAGGDVLPRKKPNTCPHQTQTSYPKNSLAHPEASTHVLKPVLEPSCLCRLSGRNGGQFTPEGSWLARMLARKPKMLVAVALANRMARTAWALLRRGEDYRDPAMAAA